MRRRRFIAACGVLVALTACGSEDPGSASDGHSHAAGEDDHGHAGEFAFGEPADGTLVDRTIQVTASDGPFRFEPDSIEVEVGEIIEFEFVNEGGAIHEFVLLEEASEDAAAGAHAHDDEPNATARLDPGESGTVAWKFTTPGEFVYECHVDAHHLAGMRGTITVSEG